MGDTGNKRGSVFVARRLGREDVVIYRDPAAYTSHPCVARLANGEYVVAFNESLARRPYLHPPSDPRFVNVVARSVDAGRHWTVPQVAPGYEWTGVECPGITQISSGEVLLNQWRHSWYPLDTARRMMEQSDHLGLLIRDPVSRAWRPPRDAQDWERAALPWARGDIGTFVSISGDGGRTWDRWVHIDNRPFARGYSPHPACELHDGTLLLALGSHDIDELATCYVVRSSDRGHSWGTPIPTSTAYTRLAVG